MLESISFTQDWRCFKTGEEFIFRPDVNLLVGDQGCGKSSLLTAIRRDGIPNMSISDPDKLKDSVAKVIATECQSYTFDFERDNVRTKAHMGNTPVFQILSKWKSHGETNLAILENLTGVKDSVIFMDEPDMALSIRSIHFLVGLFEKFASNGNQVIASVHNPIVIEAFPRVLSLEHRAWISCHKFILSQGREA